jgi:acetate kinase
MRPVPHRTRVRETADQIVCCSVATVDRTRSHHGGQEFLEPVRIDAAADQRLEQLSDLALLHNRPALAGIPHPTPTPPSADAGGPV